MHQRTIAGLLAAITVLLAVHLIVQATQPARADGGETGGCCLKDGTCFVVPQSECDDIGGIWLGAGSDCGGCGAPGACCLTDGTCTDVIDHFCELFGGVWQGPGTDCTSPCPGACCLPDGGCAFIPEADCAAQGGIYYGDGVTNCPPDSPCEIFGACCIPALGNCIIVNQPDCENVQLGEWKGPDTNCDDADFNGSPDICENTCPSDLDGDGETGIIDFLILLEKWGPCE